MDHSKIINELSRNKDVFRDLLHGLTREMYLWKPAPEKWCLLEIICHLFDEEREDFRARTKHVLETPDDPMTPIDPVAWVKERAYLEQDFEPSLEKFLKERNASVDWLQSLESPKWINTYAHPKIGPLTAKMFLANWLAHDYLHIRQILRVKFEYFRQLTDENMDYAGNW